MNTEVEKRIIISYDNVSKKVFEPFMNMAYIDKTQETILSPKGKERNWIIDNRVPLSCTQHLRAATEFIIGILNKTNITQIAVSGVGAAPLGGAVVATAPFLVNMGVVRNKSTGYGRNRIIEGSIVNTKPILVIDDIMNSGISSFKPINVLKTHKFQNIHFASLVWFDWGTGFEKLLKQNIPYHYGIRISRKPKNNEHR